MKDKVIPDIHTHPDPKFREALEALEKNEGAQFHCIRCGARALICPIGDHKLPTLMEMSCKNCQVVTRWIQEEVN